MAGVLRTETGDINFIWKLVLALVLNIVLIILSRFLLMFSAQQVFILQGTNPDLAFQDAQIFVSESAEGQAIASSLDLLLIFVLVFMFITRIEKKEFELAELGLNLQRNTLPFVVLGAILGIILFLGAAMAAIVLGTLEFPILPDFTQWPITSMLVASIVFYILNSFWQEVLFRGYLQTRAVENYGLLIGVIAITVVFVFFHGLVQTLTPIGILTGILLFLFMGLLYDRTKSLYLVGSLHAVLNFFPVLFNTWWQGFEATVVYGVALVVLVVGTYISKRHE